MKKHHKTKPLTLGLLAIGLFLATATTGCRSTAPSQKTALFTTLANVPDYSGTFADAHDNEAKLRIACAAAKDASLPLHASAAWLKVWKDLAFSDGKVTLDLLNALAANPLASDVDANLLRAFAELAPATNLSK